MVSADALSISWPAEPRPTTAEGTGELPLLKGTGSPVTQQQRRTDARADGAAAHSSLPRLSKSATLPTTTLQPTVHPKLEKSPLFTSSISAHSTAARQANHDARAGMSSSLGSMLGYGVGAGGEQAALDRRERERDRQSYEALAAQHAADKVRHVCRTYVHCACV